MLYVEISLVPQDLQRQIYELLHLLSVLVKILNMTYFHFQAFSILNVSIIITDRNAVFSFIGY